MPVAVRELSYELVRVYLGADAIDRTNYDQMGDQAHALLASWLRQGGVFPPSPKLEQEMQLIEWKSVHRRTQDRVVELQSSTRKKDIRKVLHRSPDRLDSLRVFAIAAMLRDVLLRPGMRTRQIVVEEPQVLPYDPYRGRAVDPYV
jgi:hypothetical protein